MRPAEAQPQVVVALGRLEMQGLPVHTDVMGLAGRQQQVGALRGQLHAGGVHPGDVDLQPEGLGQIHALIVRRTEVR